MAKFIVTASKVVRFEVAIEASNEEEACSLFNIGEYDEENDIEATDVEFLEIKEDN
jgi:hypothetical protein